MDNEKQTKPDFGNVKKGVIGFILLFGAFLAALIMGLFLPSIQIVKEELQLNNQQIDIILAMYQITSGIFPLYWGPLADKYGTKLMLIITYVIFIIANIGCFFSSNFILLVSMVSLIGVGFAGPIVIGSNLISFVFEKDLIMKSYFIAPLMGSAFGPILGGYFTDFFGWRMNFMIVFAITTLLLTLLIFVLPETPKQKSEASIITMPLDTLKLLFDHWKIFACVVIISFQFGSNYIILATQTVKMELEYKLNSSEIGLTYLPTGLGCILATVLGNPLLSKIIQKKGNKFMFILLIIIQFMLIVTMVFNGYFLKSIYNIYYSLFFQMFIAFSSVVSLSCMASYIITLKPNQTGAISALPTFFRSVTAAIYSFVNTPITDSLGYFSLMFIMASMNFFCIALLFLMLLKK